MPGHEPRSIILTLSEPELTTSLYRWLSRDSAGDSEIALSTASEEARHRGEQTMGDWPELIMASVANVLAFINLLVAYFAWRDARKGGDKIELCIKVSNDVIMVEASQSEADIRQIAAAVEDSLKNES